MSPGLFAIPAAGAAVAGSLVCAWAASSPQAKLFGPVQSRVEGEKRVALTFDDGPNPAVTPRLLRLLEDYHVPATFYLIGKHVRACPDLARDIVAHGHALGNHTDTHPNLFWCSGVEVEAELKRCRETVVEVTGQSMTSMRPPYGMRNPFLAQAARRMGYRVITWSLIGWDWKPQPLPEMVKRLRRVRGGDIVCLHDGAPEALGADRTHTLRALDYWLPKWVEQGIEFVTL